MWIIAGLGNPGIEYERTRHNYGFLLIDRLCRDWGVALSRTTPHAAYEVVRRRGGEVVLIKPLTYMNRSGLAVRELLNHFRALPDRLIVAHDDLDLEFGTLKMRRNGGPGSHNGVASVVEELETRAFGRLRLGIGPRPREWSGVDFVLSPFEEGEEGRVVEVLDHARLGVETLLTRGFEVAMNLVNRKSLIQGESDQADGSKKVIED